MTSLLIPTLLALAFASAQQQVPMSIIDELKVAGNNPFFYCSDPDPYTLQIAYIDITPPDPTEWRPGHNITIEIDGHNQQIIEPDAVVNISIIRRGPDGTWKTLRVRQQDLCLNLKTMFDEECPVRSGVSTESRNFTIPPETSRGYYYLVIDAYTKFKERITCVHAAISV